MNLVPLLSSVPVRGCRVLRGYAYSCTAVLLLFVGQRVISGAVASVRHFVLSLWVPTRASAALLIFIKSLTSTGKLEKRNRDVYSHGAVLRIVVSLQL